MSPTCDVLVIGGGPAGATSALLLARQGWEVLLAERSRFPRRKVCGEYLSATSLPLLGQLGVGEVHALEAGPPVKRVGLFAREDVLEAPLPAQPPPHPPWGRALSRDRLDTLLLQQTVKAGARVRQPCSVRRVEHRGDHYAVSLRCEDGGAVDEIRASLVVAAHGSWEASDPIARTAARRPSGRDLLGFKAHFRGSTLPSDLMPLVVFPGGYGGMVSCEDGLVSLSCCIRRDTLKRVRGNAAEAAGEAVLAHVQRSCRGVREVLSGSQRQGAWLAAGPIRPGIRLPGVAGIFRVGNAAGEAHPVVAEGISMAIQGAWLLAEELGRWKAGGARRAQLDLAQARYGAAWRRAFGFRLQVSRVLAHWGMRPASVRLVTPFLRLYPPLLSFGARLSGKASVVARVP